MRILVIDNFDSFTFNLVHYLESFNCEVTVWRNHEIDFSSVFSFHKVVISPGPGLPHDAGDLMDFLVQFYGKIPILGVCLGFQAVALLRGLTLTNLNEVAHGISSEVFLENGGGYYFYDFPPVFHVGRYHSWVVDEMEIDYQFLVTSKTQEGLIMSAEDLKNKFLGVQFHPESIMTDLGKLMISRWLNG